MMLTIWLDEFTPRASPVLGTLHEAEFTSRASPVPGTMHDAAMLSRRACPIDLPFLGILGAMGGPLCEFESLKSCALELAISMNCLVSWVGCDFPVGSLSRRSFCCLLMALSCLDNAHLYGPRCRRYQ